MPAVFKTNLPLAKAKPIGYLGSTSGIMYLKKKWKKPTAQEQPEQRVEIRERNSPAGTKVNEEGGWGAPGNKAEIPL
ncbi:protein pxr1-like [Willisornis vidua]|uniref:Protein pxr1-like n=1 Tax=Willisornis vidua TaxID=1566151 RepID=A0ABQ9DIB7_9PASS|nr:protein pxr1-like [Willisornis vidua]